MLALTYKTAPAFEAIETLFFSSICFGLYSTALAGWFRWTWRQGKVPVARGEWMERKDFPRLFVVFWWVQSTMLVGIGVLIFRVAFGSLF